MTSFFKAWLRKMDRLLARPPCTAAGALAIAALALNTSACSLIGEKEPEPISARLQSATGCLDSLGSQANQFWEGSLSESDFDLSAQCLERAFTNLTQQVEGAQRRQALSTREFQKFLNTFIVPREPLNTESTEALLALKAYWVGGSPDHWENTDTEQLLKWVKILRNEGPDWLKAIGAFRRSGSETLWQNLKDLSIQTESEFLELLNQTLSARSIERKQIQTLSNELLRRLGKADLQGDSVSTALDLLEHANELIAGVRTSPGVFPPETKTLLIRSAVRALPALIGFSLSDDAVRSASLGGKPLASETPPVELDLKRQKQRASFLKDLFLTLPELVSREGVSIEVSDLQAWATPLLSDTNRQRLEIWAPLLKQLIVGGDPERFSRVDLRNLFQLLPQLAFATLRPTQDRWRPQLLISAFLSGWARIREIEGDAAFPSPFAEIRILDAVLKLETIDPSYRLPDSLSSSLPSALKLARHTLEGPESGNDIEWERWLSLLRLAATLDGPLLEMQSSPDRRLNIIRVLLDRILENTRCTGDCIPLEALHEFLGDDLAGTPIEGIQAFAAAKQLLLGGGPEYLSLADLRRLKDTLETVLPVILEAWKRSNEGALEVWRDQFDTLLIAFGRNHPQGVPLRLLESLQDNFFKSARIQLKPAVYMGPVNPESTPTLARLILETFTGLELKGSNPIIPLKSWEPAVTSIRRFLQAIPANTSEELVEFVRKALRSPESWRSLRIELGRLPLHHPHRRLPWRLIEAWIHYADQNGWTPKNASAQELSKLTRAVLGAFQRDAWEYSGNISVLQLQRLLFTLAILSPHAVELGELAAEFERQIAENPASYWQSVDDSLLRLESGAAKLSVIYPGKTGLPIQAVARIVDELPKNWFSLDRVHIKNGIAPVFKRLWKCKAEEAFCPEGMSGLIQQLRKHVRAEKLAAEFSRIHPEADPTLPRDTYLSILDAFGEQLDDPAERELWNHWKAIPVKYPQFFQGDPEQAFFKPTHGIFEANTRVFFHFERFCDFFMRAYDTRKKSTPERTAPIQLAEFNLMADDFDDLAKAFRVLETRTPEMAATRFREAGLFSPHGNGDSELNLEEFTGYLALIWSAKTLVKTIATTLNDECRLAEEKLDLLGRPYLDMKCFRAGFTGKHLDLFLANLPGLLADWKTWTPQKRAQFMSAMERTGRERGFGDTPIPINDIDGIISLLQYLESLTLRFDENQDGALDQREVDLMFPNIQDIISAAVRKQGSDSIADNPEMLKSLFTWVLTRKELPKGPLPLGFLLWHGSRDERVFRIRRFDAMIAISLLMGSPPK